MEMQHVHKVQNRVVRCSGVIIEKCACLAERITWEEHKEKYSGLVWREPRQSVLIDKNGVRLTCISSPSPDFEQNDYKHLVELPETKGYVVLSEHRGYCALSRNLAVDNGVLTYTVIDGAASSSSPTQEIQWKIPLNLLVGMDETPHNVEYVKTSLGFYTSREQEECFS